MTPDDFEIIEAMEKYGGSFMRAIAYAAMRADMFNLEKLKCTFETEWKQYKNMAEREKKVQNEKDNTVLPVTK